MQALGEKDLEVLKGDSYPDVTPLIVAIAHLNSGAIELLLSEESDSKKKIVADVNFADGGRGLTPLMYAVKTNDADVVSQVLIRGGEAPAARMTAGAIRARLGDVDLGATDLDGYGVLHHMIEVTRKPKCTYDNAALYKMLVGVGCVAANIKNSRTGESKTTVQLAEEMGAVAIASAMKASVKKTIQIPDVEDCVDDWGWDMFDVKEDAEAMLKILEKKAIQAEKKFEKKKKSNQGGDVDMDSDDEDVDGETYGVVKDELKDKPEGCTATDEAKLYKGYSVLMQKIDVKYGAWGMYNFYRMQIWKEEHKDLWILFTNWGRIGHYSQGQYQNTPFGSAEQAVAEFEKIFKAKAGNEWSDDIRSNFEIKTGRYRLVEAEHLQRVRKKELQFDLESSIPSKLPKSVQRLFSDLTNVSMYVNAYKSIGCDVESMPFGRIKKEAVMEAKDILDKLEKLIKKNERFDTEIAKLKRKARLTSESDQKKIKDEEAKKQELVEEIYRLSSEYYYKLPKGNVEYTNLQVIDSEHNLDQERARVDFVLYLETAERLLLGAQYRKEEVNPIDYIYRAVACKVKPLKPTDDQTAMVLRYIYNSPRARNLVR